MATWSTKKLKNITTKIGSGATPRGGKESYGETGMPLIRSLNIYDLKFDYNKLALINESQATKLNNATVEKDDVLLNITGASVCRCTSVPDQLVPARVNQHVLIIRADKKELSGKFLKYLLVSSLYKRELLGLARTGATREALTKSDIENFQLKLPDLPTQTRISSVLSAYDDLIKNNEERIKILEEMAQLLYTEWFVKFKFPGHEKVKMVESGTVHGKIPKGWEVEPLRSHAKYISRGLTPTYDSLNKSKVLNQKCIRNYRINFEKSRSQNKAISDEKLLYFGDILINSTGVGTLGRVAQVYEELENHTVDTHITIVRPITEGFIDYLGLAMFHNQSNFELLGVGATGQTELSRDSIGNLTLVIPPLKQVTKFSAIVRTARLEIIELQDENEILSQTRDLLIPQLVTGRREV